jgi:hypothetical protein
MSDIPRPLLSSLPLDFPVPFNNIERFMDRIQRASSQFSSNDNLNNKTDSELRRSMKSTFTKLNVFLSEGHMFGTLDTQNAGVARAEFVNTMRPLLDQNASISPDKQYFLARVWLSEFINFEKSAPGIPVAAPVPSPPIGVFTVSPGLPAINLYTPEMEYLDRIRRPYQGPNSLAPIGSHARKGVCSYMTMDVSDWSQQHCSGFLRDVLYHFKRTDEMDQSKAWYRDVVNKWNTCIVDADTAADVAGARAAVKVLQTFYIQHYVEIYGLLPVRLSSSSPETEERRGTSMVSWLASIM